MVTKSEATRVLKWLAETALPDYAEVTVITLGTADPLSVTGRQTAVAIARTQGAGEFLQHAANLLEQVPDEE